MFIQISRTTENSNPRIDSLSWYIAIEKVHLELKLKLHEIRTHHRTEQNALIRNLISHGKALVLIENQILADVVLVYGKEIDGMQKGINKDKLEKDDRLVG